MTPLIPTPPPAIVLTPEEGRDRLNDLIGEVLDAASVDRRACWETVSKRVLDMARIAAAVQRSFPEEPAPSIFSNPGVSPEARAMLRTLATGPFSEKRFA